MSEHWAEDIPFMQVLSICDAYERGFGQFDRELANPYKTGTPEATAYQLGKEEGQAKNS